MQTPRNQVGFTLLEILVVLILSEDLPTVMHLPVGGLMLFALYEGFQDWQKLVDSATPIYLEDE